METGALDEATLLSLLEGCEMAEDADAIPCNIVDSPLSPLHVSKPAVKRSSWRLQRRDELLSLQRTEQQLSAQLQQLKQQMRPKTRTSSTKKQPLISSLHGIKQRSWEELCERQVLRRQQSEQQNQQLKNEVKHRLWQAKMLLKGFKRRLRNDVVGSSAKLCKHFKVDDRGVAPPTDNEQVFHDLLLGVDEIYAGVTEFFTKLKVHELPCPGRRNLTSRSRTKGKFVELFDCYAVPFGLQDTVKAIWKCLGKEEPQSLKPALVQHFDEDDNTLKQSMCSGFTAGSVHIRVIMRKVGRKYVEQDRAVFIFRRFIQPLDVGVRITFVETTRLVVRPGRPSDLGPTTMMQSHRQSTASHDAYAVGGRKVPRAFIDMGVAAWESSIMRFNHFVEDTLIREPQ